MDTPLPPRPAIIAEYGPVYTLRNVARIPGDGGTYLVVAIPCSGNRIPQKAANNNLGGRLWQPLSTTLLD